jgi:hypothetical protein
VSGVTVVVDDVVPVSLVLGCGVVVVDEVDDVVGVAVPVEAVDVVPEAPTSTATRLANPPTLAAAATARLRRMVRSRARRSS